MSLGSVLLFDIVPYDSYTTAIGYTGVFMGIGTIIGPPFTGYFYTMSQNYTITFCTAAGSALLCGILYLSANILNTRNRNEMEN